MPGDPITELALTKQEAFDLQVRIEIERDPREVPALQGRLDAAKARVRELKPEVKKLDAESVKVIKRAAKEYAQARATLVRARGHRRDPGLRALPEGATNVAEALLAITNLEPVPDKVPNLEPREVRDFYTGHTRQIESDEQRALKHRARQQRVRERRSNASA
jgi:hypothetical protein